jgi:RNA polymerase sigma factor (sigma-70 family)
MKDPNRERSGHCADLAVEPRSDEVLLTGFAIGDREPALAFTRRFQADVYGIAFAVTGSSIQAEEVAASVFEEAARSADAYDCRRSSVGTWLAGLTAHTSFDAIAARGPEQTLPPTPPTRTGVHIADHDKAAHQERRAGVRGALHQLPADQARVLVLASIAGLSAAQVACAEGIPIGTARTRIRTAMHGLRAALVQSEAHGPSPCSP